MKNNNKTYGCELIQKMKQDIDKLKKDTFTIPCLVKIVLSLAGIIIFAFVVRTFIPSRSPETINYNIIVNKANENCKSEIKTEMAEALVKVEERAVNAYNDNFATLLTILTIFGIAWPVIIALLQFKFNETTQNAAQKSLKQSEDAIKNLIVFQKELYHLAAENYLLNAYFWGRESKIGKQQNNQRMEINGIRCSVRAYIKTIYYYAKADELENANHYVRITIDLLDGLQRRSGVKKTQKISDIDWKLFLNLGIDNADEIKEKSETIFCKD